MLGRLPLVEMTLVLVIIFAMVLQKINSNKKVYTHVVAKKK